MQRVVSAFLIPLVLASQGLCAAHSHAGESVLERLGHAGRPHIHLHNGDEHEHPHHTHDHDHSLSLDAAIESGAAVLHCGQNADHDSDAFYVSDAQLFKNARQTSLADIDLFIARSILDAPAFVAELRLCIGCGTPPPLRGPACPLYLRVRSIRC